MPDRNPDLASVPYVAVGGICTACDPEPGGFRDTS
jgi:hypothetical protein